MDELYMAFDVGGTFTKGGLVTKEGELVEGTEEQFDSRSNEDPQTILDHFHGMMKGLALKAGETKIAGIGFAFPGPFDYERGVCLIDGLDKFGGLYGMNIGSELRRRIETDPEKALPEKVPILFENDASLYALGEVEIGHAGRYDRSICLTIGTGAGSAFVDRGSIVKKRPDVPAEGWVYNKPFGESIVDDYISRRGILRLAAAYGFDMNGIDVAELAGMARKEIERAQKVFTKFGEQIGIMLLPYVHAFRPQAIILGGQISKSYDLFGQAMHDLLLGNGAEVDILISKHSSRNTLAGIARMLRTNRD